MTRPGGCGFIRRLALDAALLIGVTFTPVLLAAQTPEDASLNVDTSIGSRQWTDMSHLQAVSKRRGKSTLTVMTPLQGPGELLSEPSIAASRVNPAIVVVGANELNGGIMRLFTSTSGGVSFPIETRVDEIAGMTYPLTSDPVVRADGQTTMYFAGVGFTDDCMAPTPNAIFTTKSTDGGQTWAPIVKVDETLNGGHVFHDKPWMAINRWQGTPGFGRLWVNWNKFVGPPCPVYGTPQIQTSANAGASWTAPVSIFQASADDAAVWPGDVVALQDGSALTAYVGEANPGTDLVRVVKCTPTSCSLAASLSAVPIPDDSYRFPNLPYTRSNSIPGLAVDDLPNGDGAVLLVWTDIRTAQGQIRVAVSTTGGQGFQVQGVVDSTATTDQLEPAPGWWVDSSGNRYAIVCYYQRVSETSSSMNYKCARSTDNGVHWTTTIMTSTPFTLGQQYGAVLGDYTDYDGKIRESAYTITNVATGRLQMYVEVQSFQ